MMNWNTRFDSIDQEFIAAKPYFQAINPSLPYLFRGKLVQIAKLTLTGAKIVKDIRSDKPAHVIVGNAIASQVIKRAMRPVKIPMAKLHRHMGHISKKDFYRKNGLGGRSWYGGASRQKMTIVFHDANRAGPHIDVHVGRLSVVYRVKSDLYEQLKYNSNGILTKNSQDLLIKHVRSEIISNSRVPQNLDHSVRARGSSWTHGDTESTTYGSGATRQVILESDVDIFKAYYDGPIEMYAPALWSHRALYMFKLYEGDKTKAPILIWGAKSNHPPTLDDRLHLKMVAPEIVEEGELHTKVDPTTSTAKYDGSSAYLVIGPKGTTIWSPRLSKETGDQIEYTGTLSPLAKITSPTTIVGMGEILFRTKGRFPWSKTEYIPQATGSGILNSNSVMPDNVVPEIRLYRVDKVGRKSVGNLSFWDNRNIQKDVASLDPDHLKVVELMDPAEAMASGYEGIVAVPESQSINDGVKVKWWQDPHDWQIDSVDLIPGAKGGIAGVVWFTSLESGRKFKLGPSNIGDRDMQEAMIADPDAYEGAVVKVSSRHGHEGRAAKMVGFHDDKGMG